MKPQHKAVEMRLDELIEAKDYLLMEGWDPRYRESNIRRIKRLNKQIREREMGSEFGRFIQIQIDQRLKAAGIFPATRSKAR
ncbi:MAG: hypothetical protein MOB07_16320 [Acidobacteria bacterium]|nr:hypothetical protein [Acidobacteriota bacterium]